MTIKSVKCLKKDLLENLITYLLYSYFEIKINFLVALTN
jgi:hypothetical protein